MDIYNNGNTVQYKQYGKQEIVNVVKKSKIYIFFALALTLTGLVTFITPYLYEYALFHNEGLYRTLLTLSIIGSIVVLLPISIYMSVSASTNRPSKSPVLMIIMFSLYASFFGLITGTIIYALMLSEGVEAIRLVSYAFFISAGVFLLCGIIGTLTKDMSPAISILSSLFIGTLVLVLLNIFLQSSLISWIVSFAFLAYILIITTYDFHMINRIAGRSTFGNPNITALYCAFNIYVDFIFIFIRILYILMIVFANKK